MAASEAVASRSMDRKQRQPEAVVVRSGGSVSGDGGVSGCGIGLAAALDTGVAVAMEEA